MARVMVFELDFTIGVDRYTLRKDVFFGWLLCFEQMRVE